MIPPDHGSHIRTPAGVQTPQRASHPGSPSRCRCRALATRSFSFAVAGFASRRGAGKSIIKPTSLRRSPSPQTLEPANPNQAVIVSRAFQRRCRFDKPFRQTQGPEPAEGLKAPSLPRGWRWSRTEARKSNHLRALNWSGAVSTGRFDKLKVPSLPRDSRPRACRGAGGGLGKGREKYHVLRLTALCKIRRTPAPPSLPHSRRRRRHSL